MVAKICISPVCYEIPEEILQSGSKVACVYVAYWRQIGKLKVDRGGVNRQQSCVEFFLEVSLAVRSLRRRTGEDVGGGAIGCSARTFPAQIDCVPSGGFTMALCVPASATSSTSQPAGQSSSSGPSSIWTLEVHRVECSQHVVTFLQCVASSVAAEATLPYLDPHSPKQQCGRINCARCKQLISNVI